MQAFDLSQLRVRGYMDVLENVVGCTSILFEHKSQIFLTFCCRAICKIKIDKFNFIFHISTFTCLQIILAPKFFAPNIFIDPEFLWTRNILDPTFFKTDNVLPSSAKLQLLLGWVKPYFQFFQPPDPADPADPTQQE